MKKFFIAMVTEEESESDLYYVDDSYSIQRIKNNVTPEVYDKETLEDAKQGLEDILTIKMVNSSCGRETFDIKQIEALQTAISTINDILMLYNNN